MFLIYSCFVVLFCRFSQPEKRKKKKKKGTSLSLTLLDFLSIQNYDLLSMNFLVLR